MKRHRTGLIIVIVTTMLFLQCASTIEKKAVQPKEARSLYQQGRTALDNGEWEAAAVAFHHAIQADPSLPHGYAGLALVLGIRGEYDKALEYAEKALRRDAEFIETHIIRGRIYELRVESGDAENALQAFNRAVELAPKNEQALFLKAERLRETGNMEAALEVYERLAKLGGEYEQRARVVLRTAEKIKRANPQSDIAQTIVLKDTCTRADLAALIVEELDLAEIMEKRRPKSYQSGYDEPQPFGFGADNLTDIKDHWAADWIRQAVQAGAMDAYPDGTFRPRQPVSRMELAMTLQMVYIVITGNQSIATRFVNKPSPFPDVSRSHYAYNAIYWATDQGIMTYNSDSGEFELHNVVSGLRAQLAVNNLRRQWQS